MTRINNFIFSQTGISTIITVIVSVGLAIYFNPLSSPSRGLSVAITENAFVTANKKISPKGSLAFAYNNEQVPNLISTKIRIQNTGREPVERKDFVQGLNFNFPADTRIIDLKVTQMQPPQDPSPYQQNFVNRTNSTIQFVPELINPSEIFDLDVLTTRAEDISETAHLAYKKGEIAMLYKIYGISSVENVSAIETARDRQYSARQSLKEAWAEIILPFGSAAIALFVFSIVMTKIVSLIPREPLMEGGLIRVNRIMKIIFACLGIGFCLLLVYGTGMTIYNAYFLPI